MSATPAAPSALPRWLPFEWIVAIRFLSEGRMQTAFIIGGVAIGVGVIVFMSALLSGLQANFVRRALTTAPDYKGAFDGVFGGKGRDRFGELAAGEQVTGEERAWLDAHVHADGEVDEYEQALLDFLAEG